MSNVAGSSTLSAGKMRIAIWCIAVFVLAFGVRMIVWHGNRAAIDSVMTGLTAGYESDARLLIAGLTPLFVSGPAPPSDATVLAHPPGYSILLAAVYKSFGESHTAIRILQIAVDSFAAALVLLIAAEAISRAVGVIASIIVAVSPQLSYNSLLLLPDSLAVVPMLLAVYLIVRWYRDREISQLVYAGALVGVSCWLRPNALFLPFFFAALVAYYSPRGRRLSRPVALVLGALFVIAPITIRNLIVFRSFVPLSLGSGVTMVEGVADYDSDGEFGLPKTDVELLKMEAAKYERPEYAGSLYNPDGIWRERARVAWAGSIIREHPLWFAGVMARRGISTLRLERVPVIAGSITATHDEGSPLLSYVRIILKAIQKVYITAVMLPLALVGLIVLIKKRRELQFGALLIVPLYFMCIQSLLHTEYRYVLAVNYFVLMLVAIALASIISTVRQKWEKAA